MEQPLLDWAGRITYMSAKEDQRQTDLYTMDLIWLLTKRYYEELPQPSKMYNGEIKQDKRTAEQIKKSILKKLGGG